jgi:hypothetical protein
MGGEFKIYGERCMQGFDGETLMLESPTLSHTGIPAEKLLS